MLLQQLANAIRMLTVDATTNAGTGHPGMPMGMADIAAVVWLKHLRHNPNNPKFVNRDRFILSNGHGSLLHYALLHLTGYQISTADLQNFRCLHSITPGHPEVGLTPGVETSTGPLGQGLANGVGMAISERFLASKYNRPNYQLIDHFTYVFVGDGCLMEGISHEAASLAGTLGLAKLIVLYDDNNLSIDGEVSGWFTDNTSERFRAYNWQVLDDIDGHDYAQINAAIVEAKANESQPTLIKLKTVLGYGSSNFAGTAQAHGTPFTRQEADNIRSNLDWEHPPFVIPAELLQAVDARETGNNLELAWQTLLSQYQQQYPKLANELLAVLAGDFGQHKVELADNLFNKVADLALAGRQISQQCLNYLVDNVANLIGGSADLTASNMTKANSVSVFTKDNYTGNYINYGVREFAMTAIANGMALHGGTIPFVATFLVFSDYARNAIRMAALMRQRVIFVYTHDSIGLGEDGPTHQPIEHINSLRLIPNLQVWRPGHSIEVAQAWLSALQYQGPSAILLSKQPLMNPSLVEQQSCASGGYILKDAIEPQVVLIATGSELALAMEAAAALPQIAIRVIAMPCVEVFRAQEPAYQESVLPSDITKRIAIEAGSTSGWYEFVGRQGRVVGLEQYGHSASCQQLYDFFELTVTRITAEILTLLNEE